MSVDAIRKEKDVPVVCADHNGLITFVNKTFESVFGWRSSEIIGRPLTAIIPGKLHDAHHLGFSRFVTAGKPTILNRPLKLRAVAKDGREFDAEHFIEAELQAGRWAFAARIRPIPGT